MTYLHTYREIFQSSGKSSYVEHLDGELQFFHLTHEKRERGLERVEGGKFHVLAERRCVRKERRRKWSPVILHAGFQAPLEACVTLLKPSDGDYDRLHEMPCSLIISLTSL